MGFLQVFILEEVEVVCFVIVLQVLILLGLADGRSGWAKIGAVWGLANTKKNNTG
jgi:hypothetical protein